MGALELLGVTGLTGAAFVVVTLAKNKLEAQIAKDEQPARPTCDHHHCCKDCTR